MRSKIAKVDFVNYVTHISSPHMAIRQANVVG